MYINNIVRHNVSTFLLFLFLLLLYMFTLMQIGQKLKRIDLYVLLAYKNVSGIRYMDGQVAYKSIDTGTG